MTRPHETWASANTRRACLDCGASEAHLYTYNGHAVRVCVLCVGRWSEYRLTPRAPLPCEGARADDTAEVSP